MDKMAELFRQHIERTFADMVLQRGAFATDPVLDAKMAKAGYYWCPFTREWLKRKCAHIR